LECGGGQPYIIEVFDKVKQRETGAGSPPKIGSFQVTKQMMECMVDNELKVHFQFGKRQSLSGAVSCFNHNEFIRKGRRDN